MADLFLGDADIAAQALEDCGYPELAATVRGLIDRCDTLSDLLDEAHAEIDRAGGRGGGRYWPTVKAFNLPRLTTVDTGATP